MIMGCCPSCGKQFELHVTVGSQEGLRVGDTAICIGCASPLVLTELPYEFRLMTKEEVEALDYGTRSLLEQGQANIGEDRARETANRDLNKPR
ncbi:hypothetical protein E6H30_02205 [Candidatus Bathyarchaeota archaeon]|nr:MAG: hypothetical protein E6H30_02205 [Candidatus Bathyarchaeota archaeon]